MEVIAQFGEEKHMIHGGQMGNFCHFSHVREELQLERRQHEQEATKDFKETTASNG